MNKSKYPSRTVIFSVGLLMLFQCFIIYLISSNQAIFNFSLLIAIAGFIILCITTLVTLVLSFRKKAKLSELLIYFVTIIAIIVFLAYLYGNHVKPHYK